jgi:hypothetical protein
MTNQVTSTESSSTEYQDSIKAAAKRMCASLGAKGLKVPHTAMLEAIAEGLGLDNWRTLKAVIDAPRAKPEPEAPVLPPLGEWQMWTVDAIYADNNQQYGDNFEGRTPLEGAINGLMDRLTDFGNVINICDVSDANGGNCLSPTYITEIQLVANDTALRTLLREALRVNGEKSVEQRSAEWVQAVTWLHAQLDGKMEEPVPTWGVPREDAFEELTDWHAAEEQMKARSGKATGYIREGTTITATQTIEFLCTEVEQSYGGVVKLEELGERNDNVLDIAKQLYQLRAMCGYFEDVVNDQDYGFEALDWNAGEPLKL